MSEKFLSFTDLKRFLSLGLLLMMSNPAPVMADHRALPPPAEPPSLNLNSLIEEALSKNAELKAESAETEIKSAQEGPAGSYDDPTLGFEMMNYPVDSLSTGKFGMTGNQVSLSQKIPFPGKLGNKREAAEFDSKAQAKTLEAKKLEITKKVKLTYYELFLNYRKLDTLGEQKGLLEQLTTVARNNYALNRTPQAEVLNLQVETAGVIDKSLEMERKIKGLLGELNHLLGKWDHSTFFYGRPEPIHFIPLDFSKHSEHSLMDLALEKNPAIGAKRFSDEAAKSRLAVARRSYLPDFDFKLGYTFRRPSPGDNGTDFVSGMVGISIPIWAKSKQSEQVRGAIAEKIKAEALLDEQRNMLAHQVHETYSELEEASKRIQLYEGGVLPLTRQAVTSAKSAYLTRKIEYSTLLGTIQRRYQMEDAHAEALATYFSKIAELEFILGASLGVSP